MESTPPLPVLPDSSPLKASQIFLLAVVACLLVRSTHGQETNKLHCQLTNEDPHLAIAAADAIGKKRDASAIAALLKSTKDVRTATKGSFSIHGPRSVSDAAWKALHDIGEPAATVLGKQISKATDKELPYILWVMSNGKDGTVAFLSSIEKLTSHKSPSIRVAAAKCLAKLDTQNTKAVTSLTKLLESSEDNLRVLGCLGLSTKRKAAKKLIPLLEKRLADRDASVRGFAAYALGELAQTPRPTIAKLTKLTQDKSPVFNRFISKRPQMSSVSDWAKKALAKIKASDKSKPTPKK